MPVPTKKLKSTAYHESGHVVAAFHFDMPIEYVTIKPNENSLGHVRYDGKIATRLAQLKNTYTDPTNDERILIEKDIIVDFAGFYAEKKFTGQQNTIGASSDWQNAILKAGVIHSSDNIIEKFQEYCAVYAEEFVDEPVHWQQIEVIAENLLLRETLTYDEIQKLIAEITLA